MFYIKTWTNVKNNAERNIYFWNYKKNKLNINIELTIIVSIINFNYLEKNITKRNLVIDFFFFSFHIQKIVFILIKVKNKHV